MRVKKLLIAILIQAIFPFFQTCFAENPLIQTNYTADPAPMAYKDTLFLYTTHDDDNASGFVMNDWLCYTTTDMVNWTDHGVIASIKSFSWGGYNAWADQCIYKDGKFYLYCPLVKQNGPMSIGVLVANSPYGPFTDPISKPLITGTSGANDYDPSVFIDDDGQAYIYWGGNGPCMWAKLNNDMISLATSPQKAVIDGATGEAAYTEGPWLYKHNNIYYLAWASRCCPEGIGYAISDNPAGPWKCKGTIMRPSSYSDGNHPGLVDYKGTSYVFGLNYELLFSRQADRSKKERRSVCAAIMEFNTDGTIKEVPWFGLGAPSKGVPQVGSLNPYDTVQAETICWEMGIRTEVCKDAGGGMDVDSVHNNDYIKVKGVDFKTDNPKLFEARVASGTNGGTIELHIDSLNGQKIGTCSFQGTGGWQSWVTKSCEVGVVSGKHDLFFKFTGGNGTLFNFNWWKFTPSTIDARIIRSNSFNTINKVRLVAAKSRIVKIEFTEPGLHSKVLVELFDGNGRLLRSQEFRNLNTSGLSMYLNGNEIRSGIYLARVSVDNKTVLSRQLQVP